MNRVTPEIRNFARRLIAHEAGARSTDQGGSAAFAVPERMGKHIATLMGNAGRRALLLRSLAFAGAEVPWLRECRVAIDGALERPDPSDESVDSSEVLEGGVVLVAQLIGLLVAFIGERLTLQLLREVWPKMPAKDLNFKI